MRAPFRRLTLAVLVSAACSCATGGQRPRYGAAPESAVATLKTGADSVIAHLDARLRSLGIGVARSAPREGYLESSWYDVAAGANTSAPFNRLDSVVKFRFFADPVQGQT